MPDAIVPTNPSNISIREVTPSDSPLLLTWRNHPEIRSWSRNFNEIEVNAHDSWFSDWISNRRIKGFFFVIEYSGSPVGTIRFDLKAEDSFEVSILVEPSYQGKGIAKAATIAALRDIGSELPYFTIFASVHEKNTASIKLFTSLDFQESGKSGDFLEFSKNLSSKDF